MYSKVFPLFIVECCRPHSSAGAGCKRQSSSGRRPQCPACSNKFQPELPSGEMNELFYLIPLERKATCVILFVINKQ